MTSTLCMLRFIYFKSNNSILNRASELQKHRYANSRISLHHVWASRPPCSTSSLTFSHIEGAPTFSSKGISWMWTWDTTSTITSERCCVRGLLKVFNRCLNTGFNQSCIRYDVIADIVSLLISNCGLWIFVSNICLNPSVWHFCCNPTLFLINWVCFFLDSSVSLFYFLTFIWMQKTPTVVYTKDWGWGYCDGFIF